MPVQFINSTNFTVDTTLPVVEAVAVPTYPLNALNVELEESHTNDILLTDSERRHLERKNHLSKAVKIVGKAALTVAKGCSAALGGMRYF